MQSEISELFLGFIKASVPKKKTMRNKFELLQPLHGEIRQARKLGYSFKEIAEYLGKSGVTVATHQVQAYCRDVLKERPLYKRQKTLAKLVPPTEAKVFAPKSFEQGFQRNARWEK